MKARGLSIGIATYASVLFLVGCVHFTTQDETLRRNHSFLFACFAFVVPCVVLFPLSLARGTRIHCIASTLLVLFTVLMNPIVQLVYLEPLDTYLNNRWAQRFEKAQLTGKPIDEVTKLFGSDYEVVDLRPWDQNLMWDYSPLSDRLG